MDLIKVSRNSFFNKLFDVTEKELREKLKGDELDAALKQLPDETELEFMKIWRSAAPELARLQRKMSVCFDAEIQELEEDKISYLYNNKLFSVTSPSNSFSVSKKLDLSRHDALIEMNNQSCINVNTKVPDLARLEIDELNLLILIVSKFFFQIYLQ